MTAESPRRQSGRSSLQRREIARRLRPFAFLRVGRFAAGRRRAPGAVAGFADARATAGLVLLVASGAFATAGETGAPFSTLGTALSQKRSSGAFSSASLI